MNKDFNIIKPGDEIVKRYCRPCGDNQQHKVVHQECFVGTFEYEAGHYLCLECGVDS